MGNYQQNHGKRKKKKSQIVLDHRSSE